MSNLKKAKPRSTKARGKAITVRVPRPDECFYRTANAEQRVCVLLQETAGTTDILRWRYLPLAEPVLHAMFHMPTSVLFHELISQHGDCIAYPQILGLHSMIPDTWRAVEEELFTHPVYCWGCFTHGEEHNDYEYECQFARVASPYINPAFGEQLDEALLPDLISTLDHPIAQRLQFLSGDYEGEAPLEWAYIG